jgi:hypothetical protein
MKNCDNIFLYLHQTSCQVMSLFASDADWRPIT